MSQTIDITPTPRILRVLGEIPFQPWRCFAELIDNSIDSILEAKRQGLRLVDKKITVKWSNENVPAVDREITISDTGPGMLLEQVQNAARAGYSANDPIHNLGLFGMGFNIATAKLGEKTRLLSATPESRSWVGIEIDFEKMIEDRNFAAPVIEEEKENADEHGTRIVISRLKTDIFTILRNQESSLRHQLESIYTPLLLDNPDIEIYARSKKLIPRPHCVWGASRSVTRVNKKIPAVIQIDRDLGMALFDTERNVYLSATEIDEVQDQVSRPLHIVERHKRLHGWIGIQRYSDPNDFGIDFIRNGRKILISDKTLFSYENPFTGTTTLEYPVELGSTVGGRIVGEINADYLIPTYQKNDFDRNDSSWSETISALRGTGPILPRSRKNLGFSTENDAPIAVLANAFRRPEPGTKNLAVERTISREYADRFKRNEHDFITDDKWWDAAQESDRKAATKGAEDAPEVDSGPVASDNPNEYLSSQPKNDRMSLLPPVVAPVADTPDPLADSELDQLLKNSRQVDAWSKEYGYGGVAPFEVKLWELTNGNILSARESVPCRFHSEGIKCDFIFNPRHPLLATFPIDPRELLAVYLAEKYKARDLLPDIGLLFAKSLQLHLVDKRMDKVGLQERASSVFDRIREGLRNHLDRSPADVVSCIHESSGEVEETTNALLSRPELLKSFAARSDSSFEVVDFVPYRTLLRLIDRFPEMIFDGKLFKSLYSEIQLPDENATFRTRTESKDRIISFLKDALWLINQTGNLTSSEKAKDELARCSHSITFLEQEITD